jgi:ABC-type multidrug transport system ATPase subunit
MLREMTVREVIAYSAKIRLPSSWTSAEVNDFVTIILQSLGLLHVQHSFIGSEADSRGISGGQRKRVNIAIELAAAPLALFLDEPTSGLDSTGALGVVDVMKRICAIGVTVIAVLHQPRIEIFQAFDEVLLLVPGGLTAYMGPREQVISYFSDLGFIVTSHVFQLKLIELV